MPLNHQHQIEMLREILTEHAEDHCGTANECMQLERLVQSLMANDQVNPEMKSLLQEVHAYSTKGSHSPDLNQHISDHNEHLSQWVDNFNSYS